MGLGAGGAREQQGLGVGGRGGRRALQPTSALTLPRSRYARCACCAAQEMYAFTLSAYKGGIRGINLHLKARASLAATLCSSVLACRCRLPARLLLLLRPARLLAAARARPPALTSPYVASPLRTHTATPLCR